MREKNRNSIENIKKLPQFTTMNVIDGQAGLASYSSLIFYSLTIDNILNIIVLLILAGVSIATLTGDNGLLSKAEQAKVENDKAADRDQIALAYQAAMMDVLEGKADRVTANMLKEELAKNGITIAESDITEDANGVITVTMPSGNTYTVDQNGNVELAGAKPVMINVKIATDAEGTNAATSNTPEGTTLYITFGASLEGGTISKVIDDDGNQEMTANNGVYSKAVTENGKYTFTIKGTVDGEERESKSILVTVKEFENNIKPGTVISLTSTEETTEEFYVLSYDESTQKAKALAKYNLKVGANYDSSANKIADIDTTESGYGLQDEEMKGYVSGQQRNGTIAFSSSKYWDETYTPQGSSSYPWVYNDKSNLYQYIEAYKTKLGNTDKVSEVSLASYEDINTLWSNKSNYTWLYSTSYWLGSACGSSYDSVWRVETDGSFSDIYCVNSIFIGVRPVITIDMSKI